MMYLERFKDTLKVKETLQKKHKTMNALDPETNGDLNL